MDQLYNRRKFIRTAATAGIGIGASGILMSLASCQKYLDQTPEAKVSDKDVFSNYRGFQGFVDQCYNYITDYNQTAFTSSMNIGGLFASVQNYSTAKKAELGDYRGITGETDDLHNIFKTTVTQDIGLGDDGDHGIYVSGWRGIRAANLALSQLPLLANATEEERNLIEGQAYFFRAFFHFEIARCFGGLPYVDKYLQADDDLKMPRLNYRDTTEKIVYDFDQAAALLPVDWDQTTVGSQFQGANAGRATKGAALAFKARALLYAGSPMMVHESGGGYAYDNDLLKRAAEAAAEVIKLADQGIYSLVPFTNYQDNFAKKDGTYPWTSETVFARTGNGFGSGRLTNFLGRNMGLSRLGGNSITEAPTQNLVDMFETVKGLPIDDPASEYDPMHPWDNRDPRFRAGIYVDRDHMTIKNANGNRLQTYLGGRDNLNTGELRTPYICHKYQPLGVNNVDKEWTNFVFVTPHMRLAEVYMIYAEAVNEISGPLGTAGGLELTAVDAVNKVRSRSNMPDVNTKFTGDKDSFRERIWNERSVEFFAEGHRWFDIRRWHVAHLDEYKKMYSLVFDQNWTYFNKVQIGTKIFEERHYWLPFYRAQVQLYAGFPQNPGW
jgi:hypothetical protein